MIAILKLLLAHFLGDFLLQPKSWVADKEAKKAKSAKLYLHACLHGVLTLLLFCSWDYWLLALLLALSHLGIDLLKLYTQRANRQIASFLIDQALHLALLLLLWYLFFAPSIDWLAYLESTELWIYLLAIVFLTVVSSILMQKLMSQFASSLSENSDSSLPKAGMYIGILERLFVFVFVVSGRWEGIGFLIAAKSVLRFGDLKESKDRKLTEYILIGTLLSFAIALAIGLLVVGLTELPEPSDPIVEHLMESM